VGSSPATGTNFISLFFNEMVRPESKCQRNHYRVKTQSLPRYCSGITREDGIRCPSGVADTPKGMNGFITFGQKTEIMKPRFKLYRRKLGGMFYVQDNRTNKQESLNTRNRDEAVTLLHARNEAARQPQLNLQIAKAYLAGTDFVTHEVSVRGDSLNRIEAIMQRKQLSLLKTLPSHQRSLVANGQPVILEIVITEN
jgi:hypothetical protein